MADIQGKLNFIQQRQFNLFLLCRWQALFQLTVALSIVGLVYGLSVAYDAPSKSPCVRFFKWPCMYHSYT